MQLRPFERLALALLLSACTADLVAAPMRPKVERDEPAPTRGAAGRSAAGKGGVDPRFATADAGPSASSDAAITSRSLDDAGADEHADPPFDPALEPRPDSPVEPKPEAEPEPGPSATPTTPSATPAAPPRRPAADSCITATTPGDHTFACRGLTFLVMVDAQCARGGCGLIVDIHGSGMAAAQQRDTTGLHRLAPARGYLVVHPSATPEPTGGSWEADMYPAVAAFVDDVLAAFDVDRERVHVTGFSQGADMAFWFLCSRPTLIASAAAATRSEPDADCIGPRWRPRAPILYMHGATDAVTIGRARDMIDQITLLLRLGEPAELDADPEYTHQRWTAADMQLDYIEHLYARAFGAGHCVPGGTDTPAAPNNLALNSTTCTIGNIRLNWGELALQWFLDHPRSGPDQPGP